MNEKDLDQLWTILHTFDSTDAADKYTVAQDTINKLCTDVAIRALKELHNKEVKR